ncbi:MAG: Ig-like domain-containing protein, partial [Herbinix sp.]|nr:Ig-like domain-containing protein [Herbinix sp.]
MKKKLLCNCFIMLGLLLFFTVFLPNISINTATAQAAETEKEKSEAYRLNLTSVVLAKGKSIPLKTYNVGENAKIIFKSDDQEIASVSDNGLITANKVGDTVITVVIKEGTNATSLDCKVTVGPSAISVRWTQSRIIIGIDNVDTLKVIIKPSNTVETAVYDSAKQSIVTISPGGRITAKNYGLTYLYAYIDANESDGSQKNDVCTVIVTSQENVSKLENYFSEHTELNKIADSDLSTALYKFFNQEFDQTKSSALVS